MLWLSFVVIIFLNIIRFYHNLYEIVITNNSYPFPTTVHGKQELLREPMDAYVLKDMVVVLNCTVSGRVGVVQWMQDGVSLGEGWSLPGYPRYSILGAETHYIGRGLIGGLWSFNMCHFRCKMSNYIYIYVWWNIMCVQACINVVMIRTSTS